jgi:hypothetical protein
MSMRRACWNRECRALWEANDVATEIDVQFSRHDEADVSLFAPLGLDKLRGQLKKPDLPGFIAKEFEPCARLWRLPFNLIKEDSVCFHYRDL